MHTKKQKNYRRALKREEHHSIQVGGAVFVLSVAYYPNDRMAFEVRRKFYKQLADPHNPICYIKRYSRGPGEGAKYPYHQAQKALYLTAREVALNSDARMISYRYDPTMDWQTWSKDANGADWKDQALTALHGKLCVDGVEI